MDKAQPTTSVEGTETISAAGNAVPIDNTAHNVSDAPPAAEYATQANLIDPYFYDHFILDRTTLWSVNQKVGDVVTVFKCDPRDMNSGISYLSRLYNAWSGTFEIGMEIAGTGFHGGKLGIAKLPPNMNPRDMTAINYTYFPYTLADPKQQGITVFPINDQRNVQYHWMWRQEDSKFGEFAGFGGYLVVFVYQKLVVASNGNTSIAVNFSTRLGPDFQFYQIIDPTISQNPDPVTGPPLALGRYHPCLPHKLSRILITTQKTRKGGGISCTTPIGDGNGIGIQFALAPVSNAVVTARTVTIDKAHTFQNLGEALFPDFGITRTGGIMFLSFPQSAEVYRPAYVKTLTCQATTQTVKLDSVDGMASIITGHPFGIAHGAISGDTTHIATASTSDNSFVSYNDEVIILFGFAKDTENGVAASHELLEQYSVMKPLHDQRNYIYLMRNKITQQPLMYVRLNSQGVMTTTKPATATQLRIEDCELIYYDTMSTYDSLPDVPDKSGLQNALLSSQISDLRESFKELTL